MQKTVSLPKRGVGLCVKIVLCIHIVCDMQLAKLKHQTYSEM